MTLFLVNEQMPVRQNVDARWLFQVELAWPRLTVRRCLWAVTSRCLTRSWRTWTCSTGRRSSSPSAMASRCTPEVAAGNPYRATSVRTAVIPRSEVAKVEAPGPNDAALDAVERELLGRVTFDMELLAGLDDPAAAAALRPLADAYDRWLDRQDARIVGLSAAQTAAAGEALKSARAIASRLRAGIEPVGSGGVVAEAFAFANHTMWQQRVHTLIGLERRARLDLSAADAEQAVLAKPNWSWPPFQLAFVLVNLPALADPKHPERRLDIGTADLLFFPTGGGKTEAYLGLTAFTLAIRRLQGDVAGHSGEGGVGLLMRYTLRLLTAQQFQRAVTLICACEVRRHELVAAGDQRWGETPFRIGMWVGGSVSANKTQDAAQALDDLKQTGWAKGASPTPIQQPAVKAGLSLPLEPIRAGNHVIVA